MVAWGHDREGNPFRREDAMKRRKRLRGLITAALVLDLLSLPLAPVLARQRYVDPLFYQEMLWDRSLVWQDPRGAASILLWWALGGCAAVLLWWARRKLRETGRNEE